MVILDESKKINVYARVCIILRLVYNSRTDRVVRRMTYVTEKLVACVIVTRVSTNKSQELSQ